jgi:phosphomannomutase
MGDYGVNYGGHHIDFRNGLIYISPPGMQASNSDRQIFIQLDKIHGLRSKLLDELNKVNESNGNQLDISYGGSVGIAVSPIGWNKSQVLRCFETVNNIHYFGDRTEPDGNDYPLYSHPRVQGHSVTDWHDTVDKLIAIFNIKI